MKTDPAPTQLPSIYRLKPLSKPLHSTMIGHSGPCKLTFCEINHEPCLHQTGKQFPEAIHVSKNSHTQILQLWLNLKLVIYKYEKAVKCILNQPQFNKCSLTSPITSYYYWPWWSRWQHFVSHASGHVLKVIHTRLYHLVWQVLVVLYTWLIHRYNSRLCQSRHLLLSVPLRFFFHPFRLHSLY